MGLGVAGHGKERVSFTCEGPIVEWEEPQRRWCCDNKGLGCLTLAASGEFNCDVGWSQPGPVWSPEKEERCCGLKHPGCPRRGPGHGDDAELRALVPSYDCSAWTPEVGRLWSESKQRWCCEHFQVGCRPGSTEWGPFSCGVEPVGNWSPEKRRWCCENEQLGCTTVGETPALHDCSKGLEHWQSEWTVEKQDWCCIYEQKGCPEDRTGASAQAPATTTSPAPAAGGEAAPAAAAASAKQQDERCSTLYLQAEDWAVEERDWCCRNRGLHCNDASAASSQRPAAAPAPACEGAGCTSPATTSTSPLPCGEKGFVYEPRETDGMPMTLEDSIGACRQRCVTIDRCAHFSYWTVGRTCYVQTDQAVRMVGAAYESGPPVCDPSATTVAGTTGASTTSLTATATSTTTSTSTTATPTHTRTTTTTAIDAATHPTAAAVAAAAAGAGGAASPPPGADGTSPPPDAEGASAGGGGGGWVVPADSAADAAVPATVPSAEDAATPGPGVAGELETPAAPGAARGERTTSTTRRPTTTSHRHSTSRRSTLSTTTATAVPAGTTVWVITGTLPGFPDLGLRSELGTPFARRIARLGGLPTPLAFAALVSFSVVLLATAFFGCRHASRRGALEAASSGGAAALPGVGAALRLLPRLPAPLHSARQYERLRPDESSAGGFRDDVEPGALE